MDRIIQKAIPLVLEAIYKPYFEHFNVSFGFRPNKGAHDAIAGLTTHYTNGML
jgi:retron-type reverse transcriptase